MRHLRLIGTLIGARFRGRLAVEEASRLTFRVWPTDVDLSAANHAALLTVMEAGRIDFMVRSGFLALARRNGWYVPLAGLQVRFLRPLRMFQRAELTTRVVHADDGWIYIEHAMSRNGQDVALALTRSTVRQGRAQVPLDRIAAELGAARLPRDGSGVVEAFDRATAGRCRG